MTDRPHDSVSPASEPDHSPAPAAESVEAWLQAALSLGRGGLREQVAIPSPRGGYRVVTRQIVGGKP